MKPLLTSLVSRVILIILGSVLVVQLSSQWIYETTLSNEAATANQERLSDRIFVIYQTIGRLSEDVRDRTAHELSSGVLEAHWGVRARAEVPGGEAWEQLRLGLLERLKSTDPRDLLIGAEGTDAPSRHKTIVSVRLHDQTWLNVAILTPHYHPLRSWMAVLWTTAVAIIVLLVAIVLVRWLTQPLQQISEAARSFHVSSSAVRVSATGPREIQTLASAFNDMQQRIQSQVRARTHALAAVSHDLRTPLSRIRLRLEELEDAAIRASLEQDLEEMERMIEATLSYLKGGRSAENIQSVELAALLRSIVDEVTDMGHRAVLWAPNSVVVRGRRLALKRALTNLVDNAVKYGGGATISVQPDADWVAIVIVDNGPGVPEEAVASILEPFFRVENSRNAATGGFGLGLTIASEIIAGHGGNLSLRNGVAGGFEVTVRLPTEGPAATNRNKDAT